MAQRYDHYIRDYGEIEGRLVSDIFPTERGKLVLYEDHEAELATLRARVAELERDKRLAMRLMRAREDRLTAIRDTVKQNKCDDLVRVEVAYFLDCPQSEIESTTTDADLIRVLIAASKGA